MQIPVLFELFYFALVAAFSTMAAQKAAAIYSYEGLMSAPYTAFTSEGNVNIDIIPKYIDHLVSQGVTGAFVNGTTGEGLSLTMNERKATAEAWVKHGKNKLEVIIIHISANSLRDAQELASHAEKVGATGIMSLPPLFYKPKNDEQLVQYFKEISSAAPTLPLLLYHVPSFSGIEISLGDFLPKCREIVPNFLGAKFTSFDVRDLLKCHRLKDKFKLISGFEEVLLPCLACGVTAAIGAVYSFMAPLSLKILEAYKKGNIEEARKYQQRVSEAVEKIIRHGQDIASLKTVMNLTTTLDFGPPRTPLLPLDSSALENLKKDLESLNIEEWKI